jgi:hypothetical protein
MSLPHPSPLSHRERGWGEGVREDLCLPKNILMK